MAASTTPIEQRLERVPDRRLPVFYFVFGHLCLLTAFAAFTAAPRSLGGFFYHPKMLAVVNPSACFGRGCEFCVAVCPVPDCITLTTDPEASELQVCTVNYDTCIGCMACEKWCPEDYDAIRMVPFKDVVEDRDSYETASFSAELPEKK